MSINIVTLITAETTSRLTAGGISFPGLKVGDRVLGVHQPLGGIWTPPSSSNLEPIISVDDEIQQLGVGDGITIYQITLVR